MQFVFGNLAIVIVLELFSAGNGANIPYQNRGYVVDIPSRLIKGNKQWSENYYRQEPYTKNNPTNPVHQYRAIKKRPNYLGYKDKPSTYHAALPREHYTKQESGQTHRNSSLLVPFWYPNNDNRPSDNYFTNLVKYGNRYPAQDLNPPHLSAVYYHPQTTGYNPVPPRIERQLDEQPRYHKSIYHHPQSGAAPSFPPTELRQGVPPPFPTHLGIAPPSPPPHPEVAQPPPHRGVASPSPPPHPQVAPPPPHRGVSPPHTRLVLPPPHTRVAKPLPHTRVVSPPHSRVASPPPHPKMAPPPPSRPSYLGVVPERFPQYNQQRRPAYAANIYSNESDDHKTLSPYVKKNQYKAEGKTALSIYQHMPITFWKTTGYLRKDRTKRSIRDEDDHLHDWEFDEDHLHDWEFKEEEYVDAEHGDKEEGHGINDSTDVHDRKKRWASDTGEDNGDCQECAMSNASGGEEEYSADPWNYDDNDSGESRQTETWNSGSNNNDYTWNNDDNNNSGESSQTDTWNNDDNNDEYSWNNDDSLNNDDDETDSTDNTDDNDYTAEVSYTPAVQKPRPHPPPPEHNRQTAYPRRPRPPSRRAPENGPLSRHPKPHQPISQPPKSHRPQNRPGSVHDRRPNPPKSNPPQRRPVPLNGPSLGHRNPSYTLPIPPAPPRHPKSPSYPSEHLQYDWDYEECED